MVKGMLSVLATFLVVALALLLVVIGMNDRYQDGYKKGLHDGNLFASPTIPELSATPSASISPSVAPTVKQTLQRVRTVSPTVSVSPVKAVR